MKHAILLARDDPNAPNQALAQFDDAELIEELERRTAAALKRASEADTGRMATFCGAKLAEPDTEWTPYFSDWRADVHEGSERLRAAIEAAGLHP